MAEVAGRGDEEGFAVVTQQEVDAGDEGLNGRQVRAADDEAFAPVFPEFFGGEGNVVIGCIPGSSADDRGSAGLFGNAVV